MEAMSVRWKIGAVSRNGASYKFRSEAMRGDFPAGLTAWDSLSWRLQCVQRYGITGVSSDRLPLACNFLPQQNSSELNGKHGEPDFVTQSKDAFKGGHI
jgi:hypothetical protein